MAGSVAPGSRVGGIRALDFVRSRSAARVASRGALRCLNLKAGFVGLPNVGKSTLFNALVEGGKAEAANFPFCTIEPNVGLTMVPDDRLEVLANLSKSLKTVPTTLEFVDIAGLVKGASVGEGLGNKFLANIRETDLVVQVVRCFDNDDVVHVNGTVNPIDDVDVISGELALCDLVQIEKRLERLGKTSRKSKDDQQLAETEGGALRRIQEALENGKPARSVELEEEEEKLVKPLYLLTRKEVIYVANVSEEDIANGGGDNVHVAALKEKAAAEGCKVVTCSAKVESELNELEEEDKLMFLEELGITSGGLKNLVRAAYDTLGLQTYFTSGEQETRAWTIKKGYTAPQAAGVIHTDFERGFIKADTVAYDDFVRCKDWAKARDEGCLRQEGKEYVVKEGDVLLFKFNV